MIASRLTREVHLVLRSSGLTLLALTAILTASGSGGFLSARAFQIEGRVATRSAASYAVTVAPDSIVAIFGSQLVHNGVVLSGFDTDPSTPDIQLPTVLGDVTVEINGRSARFLYVSPFQINCVVPSDLEPGMGSVVVRHLAGYVIATGDIEIGNAAPAIFTANGTGEGVPAALYYRIHGDGALTIENVFEFVDGTFVPRPVDLGPQGDLVYLVLFLTGTRRVQDASEMRVLIGGHEFVPDFVGPAPGFVGLEQVNFLLPRHLSGRLKFALTVPGYTTSNICDLEVKSPAGVPPIITGLNPLIVAPNSATIEAGKTSGISFVAQPGNGGAALQNVSVAGAGFSSVTSQGNDTYLIQLTPALNATGSYTLVLHATDTEMRTATRSIALEVRAPPGNALSAESRSLVTDEDVPLNVTLTGSGGNQYRITLPAVRGVLTGVLPNVTYTPEPNFNGLDSFSFVVGNGSSESVPAKVSISVRRINDPARLVAETRYFATAGRPLQAIIHALDADLGQALSLGASGLPAGATLTQITSSSWMLAMTPGAGQIGDFPVTLTLRDDWVPPATVSQVVTISVQSVWAQTSGPAGGDVRAFAELDGVLFAGTNGNGVFRSTDRGITWSPANNNLTDPVILSLTATGSAVYAGTGGSGIFRSTDLGVSWTRSSDGLSGLFVSSLVSSGSTIFAGTNAGVFRTGDGASWSAFNMGLPSHQVSSVLLSGNALYAGTNVGMFRLTNPDGSWSAVNTGLGNLNVHCLAANETTLFAGTSGGVFRMPAAGSNWTPANSGLSVVNIVSLTATETTVFAGSVGGGVFRSSNQGANWSQATMTPSSQSAWSLASTPYGLFAGTDVGIFRSTDQGSTLFRSDAGLITAEVTAMTTSGSQILAGSSTGQVFRTADHGTSWTREDAGLTAERIYALASSANMIFAATDSGVFRSVNQGTTWVAANNGLANLAAFSLAFSGSAVFVGTSSGVFRSIDQGGSWLPANSGMTHALILSLTAHGNALIAGTDAGAFRSLDNGASWTQVINGLSAVAVNRLVTNGAAVFAGTAGGVFRTIDQGANWTRLDNGLPVGAVLSLTASGSSVLAGFGGGGGVYRTSDQGATWSTMGKFLNEENVLSLTVAAGSIFAGTNAGVLILSESAPTWTESGSGLTNRFINAMTVDGNTFIAGVFKGGIFRSTDDGVTWALSNSGLSGVADVRALTTTSSGTFAGVAGKGIFVSHDRGLNWAARSAGLTNLMINSLANDGTTIWAGTEGGFFRSVDNGQTWNAANNGLTRLNVLTLTFNSSGLFAGTDNGLFRSTNQGSSWVPVGNGLADGFIISLGTAPNGLSILVGTGSGLFRSTNQGISWTKVVNGIPEGVQVLTLTTSGSSLLAGTVNGYFVSRDNGSSWEAMNRGLTNLQVGAIAVRGSVVIVGTRAWSVFKSTLQP